MSRSKFPINFHLFAFPHLHEIKKKLLKTLSVILHTQHCECLNFIKSTEQHEAIISSNVHKTEFSNSTY